jgi:hypothetical protein
MKILVNGNTQTYERQWGVTSWQKIIWPFAKLPYKAIKIFKLGSWSPPRPLKHSQNPRVGDFYYGQNPEFFHVRSETDLVLMN